MNRHVKPPLRTSITNAQEAYTTNPLHGELRTSAEMIAMARTIGFTSPRHDSRQRAGWLIMRSRHDWKTKEKAMCCIGDAVMPNGTFPSHWTNSCSRAAARQVPGGFQWGRFHFGELSHHMAFLECAKTSLVGGSLLGQASILPEAFLLNGDWVMAENLLQSDYKTMR